jgi:Spy/CpxP family protein refolding chaperone
MDRIAKGKWQVRLAALAVFVLGFAAGALALNAYRAWSAGGIRGEHRRDRFEQMAERLQLSEEQRAQVKQILSETRAHLRALHKESEPRFEEIRRQTDERLQQVLTPEQFQQFQQMKAEPRRGRGGPRGRRGGGGPPPGDER